MEEVGAQVAAPVVIHQTLAQRFCNTHPIAKKRGPPFHSSGFIHQNPSDNWNPKSWDWDSARFVARPLQCDGVRVGSGTQIPPDLPRRKEVHSSASNTTKPGHMGKDDENLRLKLGDGDRTGNSGGSGGMNLVEGPQPVSRPNKRVRSGSPGGANHPMCQVDDCSEDLSTAKDYHRRHKVCEVHSKASKALVGKQMQRFCQQCSRLVYSLLSTIYSILLFYCWSLNFSTMITLIGSWLGCHLALVCHTLAVVFYFGTFCCMYSEQ